MTDQINLVIDRPIFNETTFREKFKYAQPVKRKPFQIVKSRLKRHFKPSRKCVINAFLSKFTIINLFLTYKPKYILKDFMSGLTVGIIQIAPSKAFEKIFLTFIKFRDSLLNNLLNLLNLKAMANATTANLPPINGLYVAFFSVIAYLIFGTSKHLSLG